MMMYEFYLMQKLEAEEASNEVKNKFGELWNADEDKEEEE